MRVVQIRYINLEYYKGWVNVLVLIETVFKVQSQTSLKVDRVNSFSFE